MKPCPKCKTPEGLVNCPRCTDDHKTENNRSAGPRTSGRKMARYDMLSLFGRARWAKALFGAYPESALRAEDDN